MSKYPTQQLPNGDVIEVYPDNFFRVQAVDPKYGQN